MLLMFKTPSNGRMSNQAIASLLRSLGPGIESRADWQERQDGVWTPAVYADGVLVTPETRRGDPQVVLISESCLNAGGFPLTLADFPSGFFFGNGVTHFMDRRLTVVVVPNASEVVARARFQGLRQVLEMEA